MFRKSIIIITNNYPWWHQSLPYPTTFQPPWHQPRWIRWYPLLGRGWRLRGRCVRREVIVEHSRWSTWIGSWYPFVSSHPRRSLSTYDYQWYSTPHSSRIIWYYYHNWYLHVHDLATQRFEVRHGGGLTISRDDDLDAFREDPGQPECYISLLVEVLLISEMIDPLEDDDNLIIDLFSVLHNLLLQLLVAQLQPIRKVSTKLLLQQFNLLCDVQGFLIY